MIMISVFDNHDYIILYLTIVDEFQHRETRVPKKNSHPLQRSTAQLRKALGLEFFIGFPPNDFQIRR